MKKCPTCKTELAENASACPKCGYRFTTTSGVAFAVVIGVVVGAIILLLILPKG
jgi:RNA polymerase subunit RPABC4/transcription elongation factor Spt4